ncbi:HAAS signaling domain-containing protein [Streptosporangium carneum]|uniref:Proline-rich protein n=1 Tax=Streptosporangium carneum TaxID=47481 RepID=A0A9W6I3W6_9ACTN|nr:hypothetical protein [Streptosporangium carneum]GLK11595.1 hypothetical protein GCM10017600_50020 [Streptosporangium carneum]
MITPDRYAQAVRDALADLPARDREELLEDLDDHLAEVAAESDAPLEERLGPPEAYAAELRAAYGDRTVAMGKKGRSLRTRLAASRDVLSRLPVYRHAEEFAPELRPAWWVLRGYVLALLLSALSGTRHILPGSPAEWVVVAAFVVVSVWLGRTAREGRPPRAVRAGIAAINALVAIVAMVVVFTAGDWNPRRDDLFYESARDAPVTQRVEMVPSGSLGGDVHNIFPYSKDGRLLEGVRLYDQEGRPITLDLEASDYRIKPVCFGEPPRTNEFPLPLVSVYSLDGDECLPSGLNVPDGVAPTAPPAVPPVEPPAQQPSPGTSPSVSPSGSPSASGSPSPSSSASASPSPSPSRTR